MSTEITVDENHLDTDHPSDGDYVRNAILLAVITAAEVATYFVDIGVALIPTLLVMMLVIFFYVAAWFMHLKFDTVVFTRFFVTGLILATAVYCLFLTVFEFWSKG